MTKKIFQGILKDTIIASHYQQDYIDSLQYTDEELQKYYEENKNSFDVANYEMITFNGAAASTKDADGRGGERRCPAEGQGRRQRGPGAGQGRRAPGQGGQGL